jgi:transcriptional antiterminator NusG
MQEQELAQVPPEESPSAGGEGQWYIIHCYSGMEERVKKNLEQRIASMDVREKVFEVVVPTEEVVEIKEGRRTPKRERLLPGYVLVRLRMDDESWFVVRNTPGVTGFISADEEGERRVRPLPLTEKEVAGIFRRMEVSQPRAKVGFVKGQNVKITDGPFQEFIGVVDEISPDKGKVTVLVSFFGRETPVELDFLQAERIG